MGAGPGDPGLMTLLVPGGGYFYARLFYPGLVFLILEAVVLGLLVVVGASVVPVNPNRFLLLGGLALTWSAIKTVGWIHIDHFLKQYIPCKARLGRWSPSLVGERSAA